MKIDERLARDAFRPDDESHIVIDQERCARCEVRRCIRMCPGQLYTLVEETGEMRVEHAGCLECGTCLVVCPEGALQWRYPCGGSGVRFRFG
jgi:ferredoxin like protein